MGDLLAQAFDEFEAAGRETREMIEATPRFRDRADHRAQAYVSLAEARAMAYNLAIAPRMDHPFVHSQTSWHSHWFSLGQNSGDFRYGSLLLDGRATYRAHGSLGDLELFLCQVYSHPMGHPDARVIGNHDLRDHAAPDGSFDLRFGAGEPIALDPDSRLNFFLIRRILGDIADDPGSVEIERIDGPAPVAETDDEAIAERLGGAAHLLRFLVREWCVGLYDLYEKAAGAVNALALIPGESLAANVAGSPSTTYALGIYELAADEALVIEWEPPESAYWSFQLGDVWSNAMDFVNHQTDVNMVTARLDSDGRLRVIVAHEDPGTPNWLDTRGRLEGVIVMRNYRARTDSVAPTLSRVALADARSALPPDTPSIAPEERRRSLAQRRARYRAAYGD